MPTYLIERHIPGAGAMSPDELRVISQKSNEILGSLGAGIRWLHSYVVDDRIYCVYEAGGTALIEEHARCMGIPADEIFEVRATISPATGGT
jgi:hypothetical protein